MSWLAWADPSADWPVQGSTASWVEMLSTNVLAVAMMQREAVADMERRAVQGHIITIGQLADAGGTGGHGFYHATKAAAASLTEGMHREVRLCTAGPPGAAPCPLSTSICKGCSVFANSRVAAF